MKGKFVSFEIEKAKFLLELVLQTSLWFGRTWESAYIEQNDEEFWMGFSVNGPKNFYEIGLGCFCFGLQVIFRMARLSLLLGPSNKNLSGNWNWNINQKKKCIVLCSQNLRQSQLIIGFSSYEKYSRNPFLKKNK